VDPSRRRKFAVRIYGAQQDPTRPLPDLKDEYLTQLLAQNENVGAIDRRNVTRAGWGKWTEM
jgi:hypothetical protein